MTEEFAYVTASIRVSTETDLSTFTFENGGTTHGSVTIHTKHGEGGIYGTPEALMRLADHIVTVAVEAAEKKEQIVEVH